MASLLILASKSSSSSSLADLIYYRRERTLHLCLSQLLAVVADVAVVDSLLLPNSLWMLYSIDFLVLHCFELLLLWQLMLDSFVVVVVVVSLDLI